jgi:hypothetical protein
MTWTPLTALAGRFDANLAALSGRYPHLAARLRAAAPAASYFVAAQGTALVLGAAAPHSDDVRPLPALLPAARAVATVVALFPGGACTEAVLVAGEDQGWLWDRLYRLPCRGAVGYRQPLHLAIADLDRLRVILHLQDWRDLLADPRVRIYAGADAVEQLGRSMADDLTVQWPGRYVTVDPAFWPAGASLTSLTAAATEARGRLLAAVTAPATPAEAAAVATRLIGGRPLRVLGITSRYTTFLQHSMRDWLAAFDALGHATHLHIEGADHELAGPLVTARACHAFRPDLVVVIDHYRAELTCLPEHVPVVMWVQDRLPHIFRTEAGAAQGPLDFCLGFGRRALTGAHGYPRERFLTCPVGTNLERYVPRAATPAEVARYGCDVSYVSHASECADQIVADYCKRQAPAVAPLLAGVLDRMRDHYAASPRVLTDAPLRRIVHAAEAATGTSLAPASVVELMGFLTQRVNNALVRHQSLLWLAELGVDLRLYGNGWDRHPQLARFARGPAGNRDELAAIYRCSSVNLQVTPFGCVHQRMLDGLAAGAFFLARWHQMDTLGCPYRQIWAWCEANGVTDDADLRRRATPAVGALVASVDDLCGHEAPAERAVLFDALRVAADSRFAISADGIWGDDYGRVAFRTRAELGEKVRAALADPAGRQAVAERMRRPVVERFSYAAITTQLLQMIARQLPCARSSPLLEAA